MYKKVEISKTLHSQLKSLKKTQYWGLGGHFSELGKTGFKKEKLSFCQINCGKMKQKFRNMKEIFVKNISSFNLMVFISISDRCTDFGMDFPNDIFEYLHLSHFDKPLNH